MAGAMSDEQLGSLDRDAQDEQKVVTASAVIDAPVGAIFELIADPARQVEWDGNDNLGEAASGQRVREVGDVFATTLTKGSVRDNHVVEFAEGRSIAWMPSEEGGQPFGQLWRWELAPAADGTAVVHTYDWSGLPADAVPGRIARARSMTSDMLMASVVRLKELAEREAAEA